MTKTNERTEKIITLINGIHKYFNADHLYCDSICWAGQFAHGIQMIEIEIHWGDWKHTHQKMKHLLEQMYEVIKWDSETTEEDGSDCYSARYTAYIVADV